MFDLLILQDRSFTGPCLLKPGFKRLNLMGVEGLIVKKSSKFNRMIYFRYIVDEPLRHLVVRLNHKQHSYTPARGTGSSSGGAICNPQRRSARGGGR